MIDLFCIFTTGGLIIWSKVFAKFKYESILNELIKTILIDEKNTQEYYIPTTVSNIILRWKVLNEAELIFVVAYQQSYNILYSDKLLDIVVRDFKDNTLPQLKRHNNIYIETPNITQYTDTFMKLLRKWEQYCQDSSLKKERSYTQSTPSGNMKTPSHKTFPGQEPEQLIQSNSFAPGSSMTSSFVMRKSQTRTPKTSSGKATKKKSDKAGRKWDDDTTKLNKKEMDDLDKSQKRDQHSTPDDVEKVRNQFLGPADPDNLNETNFDEIDNNTKSNNGGIFNKFTSTLKNYIGNKVLTEEDLQPVMDELTTLLMEKNVAREIAENLCASVKKGLLNTKTNSFTTITTTVKNALKESIAKILTPKDDLDILRQALAAKQRNEPYKIVFIGVNGVGKSTNLAKVGYMLMNNGLKIIIAACDNFRSGAVEQLKTHSQALGVDLFEKGYKDDPAYICKEAIDEAKRGGYDCVLIDTAGRMQDNEPLMKSLAKLVEINQPDAILFVGEALTGNDAVDQLKKFNQALIDNTKKGQPRTIDGIILTKFDTVDDKVGAALTMVYTTGKPIVYVGTGQKYINLKKLNVNNVLNALFG